MKEKSNKKFMFLSALGIIMVVDAHSWTTLNLFADFFPYNSFFMPMFVFISGYFNKVNSETQVFQYLVKRFKKLIIPCFIISLADFAFGELTIYIQYGQVITLPADLFLKAFINMFVGAGFCTMSFPLWFAPSLFVTELMYAVTKKVLSKWAKWYEIPALIVFAVINIFVVWFAKNQVITDSILLIGKGLFFLFFLELGIIYREYIEKRLNRANHIILMLVLLLVNMFRMMIMPDPYDIAFNELTALRGFTSPYYITPLISSCLGILFWVNIADMLWPVFEKNRLIIYISNNTFWIMGFHVAMFNVLNCILIGIDQYVARLPEFEVPVLYVTPLFRWEYNIHFRMAYFAFGLIGPLVLKYCYDRIISSLHKSEIIKKFRDNPSI